MTPQNYGQLLYNAIRETLETMAFAEVALCSFQMDGKEVSGAEALKPEWGDEGHSDRALKPPPPIQIDFTISQQSEAGGSVTASGTDDSWGTGNAPQANDAWGMSANSNTDPWETGGNYADSDFSMAAGEINFNSLVESQEDWIWSCMRVNSPDVHSVWFVVSKSLAMELAHNMYAGEDLQLDSPIIRDLVAELTNVLGGRLMLLLEKMGGQFTLAVPDIGIGLPAMPDSSTMETVLCKVLVDGEYPVISSICFNKK